jgi:hypothetical protein
VEAVTGEGETWVWADGTIYDPAIPGYRQATADELRRNTPRADDIHTCSAECPCQTGGEPRPDFIAVEGSLLPALLTMSRPISSGHRHPCLEDGCPGAECYGGRVAGCGHPTKTSGCPAGGPCPDRVKA